MLASILSGSTYKIKETITDMTYEKMLAELHELANKPQNKSIKTTNNQK